MNVNEKAVAIKKLLSRCEDAVDQVFEQDLVQFDVHGVAELLRVAMDLLEKM